MSYRQVDKESIPRICRQELVSLVPTDEGVLTNRREVNSPNMPARPNKTSSCQQHADRRLDY
jgi:hypothetical protein